MADDFTPLVPDIASLPILPPDLTAGIAEPPDLGEFPPVAIGQPVQEPPDLGTFAPEPIDPLGQLVTPEQAGAPLLAPPPLSPVQAAGVSVVERAQELDRFDRQLGALGARQRELRGQLAATTDAKEQEKLAKRMTAIQGAEQGVREERATARTQLTEQSALLDAQTQLAANEARAAAIEEQARRAEAVRAESEAKQAARETETEALRARLEDDREAYRAALKEQPKVGRGGLAVAIVGVLNESLRASRRGEIPDFTRVFADANRQAQAEWKRRAEAKLAAIGITTDELQGQARLRDEERAQEAASLAAISQETEDDLARQLQRIAEPAERARVATTLEVVRANRARAEQAAMQARQDADRKLAKDQADLRLTMAKAAKAEAEAAKAGRRGSGRGRVSRLVPGEVQRLVQAGVISATEAEDVEARGVVDPVTGRYVTRESGLPVLAKDTKLATDLNEAGARMQTTTDLVNEALSLRGKAGWEPTGKWLGSEAGRNMQSLSTQLLLMNKDAFGLGVLSDSDTKLLQSIQGGELSGMKDPRPQLRAMHRRMAEAYNRRLKVLAKDAPTVAFELATPPKLAAPEQARKTWVQARGAEIADRLAAFREELAALERKFGGVDKPDYAMQAQASIGTYLSRELPQEYKRIDAQIDAADEAKDQQEFERLLAERRKIEDFAMEMQRERTRLRMLEGAPVSEEENVRRLRDEGLIGGGPRTPMPWE